MKSKLSAAFVVAACVLAASPAGALTIIIDPVATMSSLSGPVLFDDFDSVVDTSIGTITGGRPQDPSHGTAPATGNFINSGRSSRLAVQCHRNVHKSCRLRRLRLGNARFH